MKIDSFFQKLLEFEGQFNLDGQGQGHQFRIHRDMYDVDNQNRIQIRRVNSKWFKIIKFTGNYTNIKTFMTNLTLMVMVKETFN